MTSSQSNSWVQFMMGRFVSGLGVGALSANVPIYQVRAASSHAQSPR
jgi:SP family sugar:H+ symporter-like MFS transporter